MKTKPKKEKTKYEASEKLTLEAHRQRCKEIDNEMYKLM